MRPRWPGSSLNFQFTGIIIVPPGGSSLPSGTKTSHPEGHEVMGMGSKNFDSGSLGVIVLPLPFPPVKENLQFFPVFLPCASLLFTQNTSLLTLLVTKCWGWGRGAWRGGWGGSAGCPTI